MEGIKGIDAILAVFNNGISALIATTINRPVGGMQVLTKIDPIGFDTGSMVNMHLVSCNYYLNLLLADVFSSVTFFVSPGRYSNRSPG